MPRPLSAGLLFAIIGVSHGTIQFARKVLTLAYPSTTLEITGPVAANHTKLCAVTDRYGSDACVLEWNTTYGVHLKGVMPTMTAIDKGDRITVSGAVPGWLPMEFMCHACGTPCSFELVPPWKTKITFDTPACPIYEKTFDHIFNVTTPAKPPGFIGGFIFRGSIEVGVPMQPPKMRLDVEIALGSASE